jgi:hypothetical protein
MKDIIIILSIAGLLVVLGYWIVSNMGDRKPAGVTPIPPDTTNSTSK